MDIGKAPLVVAPNLCAYVAAAAEQGISARMRRIAGIFGYCADSAC
jgi:hypothetical protein